jgi:hypothetical protein
MSDALSLPGELSVASDASSPGDAETQRELAAGLARLRRRGTLVATERWLLMAGAIMLPLGVVLVVTGWYGAAHTTRLWEEIPYLISGGLFGVVLVIIGAAFYFGYWLTRIVGGDRQVLEVLLRIEDRLNEAALATPATTRPGSARSANLELVATKTGTMFHRVDCQVVAGRPDEELRSVQFPPPPGMSACKLCAPLDDLDEEGSTTNASARA